MSRESITTNAARETEQLTDSDILIKHDMGCRHRAMVELAITHRLISDLLKAGYELKVCDGEEITTGTEQQLVNAVFAVDVAMLFAKKDGKTSGIYLVLGNDGWDVISDYGMSLEPIMKPIDQWIDAQLNAGKF